MARELEIPEDGRRVKVRSPWAPALLPFITLGVYLVVWWYRVNVEMQAYGEAQGYEIGRDPTRSALALFPGSLLIVPPLVSYWRGAVRVQGTQAVADQEPFNGWLILFLAIILFPAFFAYLQVALNKVWEQECG